MLTIEVRDGILFMAAKGRVRKEDYESFVPAFEKLMPAHSHAPMLVDATEMEGWDIDVLWRDLTFGVRHRADFGPMAVVGDETWQEWATAFSKPFVPGEVRYFHASQRDEALDWLKAQKQQAA
jgi:hypothetical protein